MHDSIFREYDIRGIVGSELIIEDCYALGKAIAVFFKENNQGCTTIILGRDGRTHSLAIKEALQQAFLDSGIDVIDVGMIPTPCLYFAVSTLKIAHGIIVTASHNPKEYNGLKIWNTYGAQLQQIKTLFKQKATITSWQSGRLYTYNIVDDYINYLVVHFAQLKNKIINTVIDCGNGAAGIVMQSLIQRLKLQNVTLLFDTVDGNFPNHEADPTVIHNMLTVKKFLTDNPKYTLGIGFDGDADRMNPMTSHGFLVPGDQLLAIYAEQVLQNNPNAAVIFDIKSSSGLTELLTTWQAQPIVSPSGHSHIKNAMKKHNAMLGGELSCHFFFNDRYFGYDDGIYAALRLIELLNNKQTTLEKLLTIFPKKFASPEFRIGCKSDSEKSCIMNNVIEYFTRKTDIHCVTIDGIRAETATGWGLARASNTQPVICLRFEASTKVEFDAIKRDFYEALTPYFDAQQLKDTLEFS